MYCDRLSFWCGVYFITSASCFKTLKPVENITLLYFNCNWTPHNRHKSIVKLDQEKFFFLARVFPFLTAMFVMNESYHFIGSEVELWIQ